MEGTITFHREIDQLYRLSSWTNSVALKLPVVRESHFIVFKKKFKSFTYLDKIEF